MTEIELIIKNYLLYPCPFSILKPKSKLVVSKIMSSNRVRANNHREYSMLAPLMIGPRVPPWPEPMSSYLCSDVFSSTSTEVRDLVKDLHSFRQSKHTTETNRLWTIERKKITRKG